MAGQTKTNEPSPRVCRNHKTHNDRTRPDTMTVHVYFSLIPEALILSNLPPAQFGQYYSTGHQYKSKGEAIFFEVDPKFRNPYFAIEEAAKRCVPKGDGTPKNSVYVSTYRVLEHIPISALGKLYLTTAYGNSLGLDKGTALPDGGPGLHLYQDLVPANSLVVSNLGPHEFCESTTIKPVKFIRFPAVCFVELGLGALAHDPENGAVNDLPYSYIHHLREALLELSPGQKASKLVHRVHSLEFAYRMVKGGFYVGNGHDFAYYPMPSHAVLRRDHATWWRNANL
jgi:hypothetical protein